MNSRKTYIIWTFFIAQLYFLFKFSNYTSYGYLIVFILSYPIYLMTKLFVEHLFETISRGEKYFFRDMAVVLILSVFLYLSVFAKWVDNNYFKSFILALSRFTFIFVFIYGFSHSLMQCSFKRTYGPNKKYMLILYALPSLVIMTLLWLASYPAIMSPDSIYIWTSAIRNSYDGLNPLMYTIGVKLLSLIWDSPAVVIIFQILLCSFTFSYVTYKLRDWGVNSFLCIILSFLLPMLPVNSINAVTMWKDIPYTMGLILISFELLRALKEKDYYEKYKNIIYFAALVILVMFTRHNAPYVLGASIVIFSGVLLYKKKMKQCLINSGILVACVIVFMLSIFLTKTALGERYKANEASSSYYALPLQGIMAAYHDANSEVTEKQFAEMGKYLYMEELQSHYQEFSENDRWRNFTRTRRILNIDQIENDKLGFLSLYFDFFMQNPVIVLRSYFNQTSIIWSSRDTSYVSGMAWYIARFDGFETIEPDSKLPALSEKVTAFLYSNPKGIRGFFEHPASMMMLILVLAYVGFRKKGVKSLVFILPAIFNSLGYMASIEGQCTRYTYINYTIAIIYFVYVLLEDNESIEQTQLSIKIT